MAVTLNLSVSQSEIERKLVPELFQEFEKCFFRSPSAGYFIYSWDRQKGYPSANGLDKCNRKAIKGTDTCVTEPVRKSITEAHRVDEYIVRNNIKLPHEIKKRVFKVINRHSEKLMEKHSNINRISVSPVISHRNGIEKRPCIVIYCSDKGKIPSDELEFPRQIEDLPVDVREGYCLRFGVTDPTKYNDPLRTGISIGGKTKEEYGTLGPFVVEAENKRSVGFLTCQHVFSTPVKGGSVFQPAICHVKTKPERTICGKITSMYTGDVTYNDKQVSVDVAYVALEKRNPKIFQFPTIPESMVTEDFHGNPRMGQPIMLLTDDGMRIYKLGQASGLTMGVWMN